MSEELLYLQVKINLISSGKLRWGMKDLLKAGLRLQPASLNPVLLSSYFSKLTGSLTLFSVGCLMGELSLPEILSVA